VTRGRWAVAGRLARREIRRHPWRHALVVGLIFVPTLAVFATFSLLRTWERTEDRSVGYELSGQSGGFGEEVAMPNGGTAHLDGLGAPVPFDRLPEGTVVERHRRGGDWLITDRERRDGDGPVLAGTQVFEAGEGTRVSDRFVVRSGRLPRSAEEVLLSEPLAEAGRWGLGSTVESARSSVRLEVVGIGVLGDETGAAAMAVTDQPDDFWTANTPGEGEMDSLVTVEEGWASLRTTEYTSAWLPDGTDPLLLESLGGTTSIGWDENDLSAAATPSILLGATAICALAATVASAAFALASRRQLRSIGLLSTVGADPGAIRAALVLQGALPGLVAGAAAVGVGLLLQVWANGTGLAERVTEVAGSRVEVAPFGAVLALSLGTLSGIVAAWQPSRTASRVPVLTALAGRRPAPPMSARVPLSGLAMWFAGALLLAIATRMDGDDTLNRFDSAVPLLVIAATALFAFGGVALAPLLVVGLDRAAARAHGTLRLASRGLVRHRAQSAAAIAAVAVALALPVGFLTAEATEPAGSVDDPYRPRSLLQDDGDAAVVAIGGELRNEVAPRLAADVEALLGPSARRLETLALADGDRVYRFVTAIDEAVAAQLLEPWAADAIAEGAAVPFGFAPASSEALEGSEIVLRSGDEARPFPLQQPPTDVYWQFEGVPEGLLIGADAIGDFGRGRPLSAVVVVRPSAYTPGEIAALDELDPSRGQQAIPTLAAVRSLDDGEATSIGLGDAQNWLEAYHRPGQTSDLTRNEVVSRTLLVLAGISAVIATIVLTITLSLRSYDGHDDARAALAAGAPPGRIRRLRAIEGLLLGGLGGLLAIPLGWLPVTAARMGQARPSGTLEVTVFDRLASPGWVTLVVVAIPAVVALVAWTVVPAARSAIRDRRTGPVDLVAPRW
jgi:hypothetical protein